MKKIIVTLILIALLVNTAYAEFTLPFTTSFNGGGCGEWSQTDTTSGTLIGCDGWRSVSSGWFCVDDTPDKEEQITSGANFSGGDGGYGQRHWQGNTDGEISGNGSGELKMVFNNNPSILQLRYYIRYEAGYWTTATANGQKWMYLYDSSGASFYLTMYPDFYLVRSSYTQTGITFSDIYSSGTSDGSWHYVEFRFDIPNSQFVIWIDGVHKGTWSHTYPVSHIHTVYFPENARPTGFSACHYIDYDDYAANSTGTYIGPISGNPYPIVTVVASDPVATEQGETPAIFTLTRDQTSGALAVTYTISGTATGGGTDYQTLSGTANFLDGNATTQVIVTAVDDTDIEGDESVIMTLTDGASYDLGDPFYAVVIITDDDQTPPPPVPLIDEDFESGAAGLSNRGWYDDTAQQVFVYDAGADARDGTDSGMVLQYTFRPGQKNPVASDDTNTLGSIRVQFSETPKLYVTYWVKFSDNWVGQGLNTYGYHIAYALTNQSPAWAGLANTYLTGYFEMNSHTAVTAAFQDAQNINQGLINTDLTGSSTTGAAHGCHGSYTNVGTNNTWGTSPTCYDGGTGYHLNKRWWEQAITSIRDGAWHQIRYLIDMNTVVGSTVNQNGTLTMWVDNMVTPVFTAADVVVKKGWFSNQYWNQFVLGPYISNGSPLAVDQTLWIDDLVVGTDDGDVVPPAIASQSPAKQATGVAVDADISSNIGDGGQGVSIATIVMHEMGNKHCCSGETCTSGTADLTCVGTSASYTVTYTPGGYSNSQQVDVTWDASDLAGNPMPTDSYYFTTVAATPTPPGTASGNGEGAAVGGGPGTISGAGP